MSLASKIFRGSTLNAADLILRMGVMFLMTPFMVSHLGMNGYGTWVLLIMVISFLDLLDGGITLSGTRFLARTIGKGDAAAYVEMAGTLAWLYHRIGWLCMVSTGVLVMSTSLFVKDPERLWEARQVLLVLGGSLTLRFFLRIHLVVLKSHVRYDLIVLSGLAKLVLQSGLIVALLLHGYGLLMLAVAQIASDVLDQILVVMFSRRTGMHKFAPLPSKALVREVLTYSTTIFFSNLGLALRTRLDALVLSLMTGVQMVAVYNTGYRLLTIYDNFTNAIIGGPVLAGFCQVEGGRGLETLRVKFFHSMRFSVPLAVLGATGLFAYGPSFLERWMGPAFSQSGTVMRLLIGPFALWMMQLPAPSMLMAMNRHQTVMKLTLVSGVFNLVVSVLLAWLIGFYGVVVASMIEMILFYGLLVPYLSAQALGISIGRYYQQAILLPLIGIAPPLVVYVLATHAWLAADYVTLAVLGAGLIVVAGGAFLFFGLTDIERRALIRKVSRRA